MPDFSPILPILSILLPVISFLNLLDGTLLPLIQECSRSFSSHSPPILLLFFFMLLEAIAIAIVLWNHGLTALRFEGSHSHAVHLVSKCWALRQKKYQSLNHMQTLGK